MPFLMQLFAKIKGSLASDILEGIEGDEYLEGLTGNDTLIGSPGADTIDGGDDIDTVSYALSPTRVVVNLQSTKGSGGYAEGDFYIGIENVIGSDGDDNITGNSLDNYLSGGAGNDILIGNRGFDTLDGGVGNDTYHVSSPTIIIDADGYDKVFATANFALTPDVAIEELFAIGLGAINLTGSSTANIFHGNDAPNVFSGLAGNDVYYVGAGDSVVEAIGHGYDIVYAEASFALDADAEVEELVASTAALIDLQGSNTDNRIVGNSGRNVLSGLAGNDKILGGAGKDTISGGSGRDTISGGSDADRLSGGSGRDVFVFDAPLQKGKADRIVDFNVRDDTIHLARSVFKKVGKKGYLQEGSFHIGTKAESASERIIYDDKTGALYYDVDGTGPKGHIKIAVLKKNLKLTHKDFYMI
ncbi:calcium-binding protein [Microvirga flavescens]|uniref:calcium-binding protein n=1 Tax=Microvirga flavescens TaxID=2249811 RepID=UPI000DDC0A44|nr:calcium-binding protein [Microvirga flavescens]